MRPDSPGNTTARFCSETASPDNRVSCPASRFPPAHCRPRRTGMPQKSFRTSPTPPTMEQANMNKMCLVWIFSAILTVSRRRRRRSRSGRSLGRPVDYRRRQHPDRQAPYPHPLHRMRPNDGSCAGPPKERTGAAGQASMHALAALVRPPDGTVPQTRCRPLRPSGRPVFRRQHRSRRGAGATGLGRRLPPIFAGLCGPRNQARRARRGIWAGTFQMPWDWRRQNRR